MRSEPTLDTANGILRFEHQEHGGKRILAAGPAKPGTRGLGDRRVGCAVELAAHRAVAIAGARQEFVDFETNASA